MRTFASRVVVGVAWLTLWPMIASAQTSAIAGTVKDPSGAFLANAQGTRVFDRAFELALEFQILFTVQLALEMQGRAEDAGRSRGGLRRCGGRRRHLAVAESFAHGFLRFNGPGRRWGILGCQTQHSAPW